MADGWQSKVKKALSAWLRKPESWLSIAAAVISIVTFYLVYAKAGELKVFFADEVGLRLQRDSTLFLVLPVTLINTGATTRPRVVDGIGSVVIKQPATPDAPSYAARWRVEFTFVGKDQYFQKYPTKASKPEDPRIVDFLDYNGRAVPFTIQGGSSVSKILGLVQEEGSFAGPVGVFTVKLRVRTGDEAYESEAQFDCGQRPIETDITRYCRRKI